MWLDELGVCDRLKLRSCLSPSLSLCACVCASRCRRQLERSRLNGRLRIAPRSTAKALLTHLLLLPFPRLRPMIDSPDAAAAQLSSSLRRSSSWVVLLAGGHQAIARLEAVDLSLLPTAPIRCRLQRLGQPLALSLSRGLIGALIDRIPGRAVSERLAGGMTERFDASPELIWLHERARRHEAQRRHASGRLPTRRSRSPDRRAHRCLRRPA